MISAQTYSDRRKKLVENLSDGIILLFGNSLLGMNYAKNYYPFRQDSTFLYYGGIDQPDLVITIDAQSGETTLYGNDPTIDDIVWTGSATTMADLAKIGAIDKAESMSDLQKKLSQWKNNKTIHYLPPYTGNHKIQLFQWLDIPFDQQMERISIPLIHAIADQRSVKSAEEIAQIEEALNKATVPMHIQAMKLALEGNNENQVFAAMQKIVQENGFSLSFPPICSVRGEILHNNIYHNEFKKDQLLIVDAGAANGMHYASDVTRTTPIGGKFNAQQKEIYEIVLNAEVTCIEKMKAGVVYRDIHFLAAKLIVEGLKSVGLMKGDTDEAVANGAHTLFFPHGIGHLLGLDVHDMENLGENNIGYTSEIVRSKDFGTAFLRYAKQVQENYVMTIEPGIYFIPELIRQWKAANKNEQFINYSKLENYNNFGGIRVEDTVLVNATTSTVIGNPIPKTVSDIESLF